MIISFDKEDINFGSNWDIHYEKIKNEDSLIFWDQFHCDRLCPLPDMPEGWNEIYKIYTSKFKTDKVYYVTNDFNIEYQVEHLKKVIPKIETEIEFIFHPYPHPYDDTNVRLENGTGIKIVDNHLRIGNFEKKFKYKYNVCSLNGTIVDHRVKWVQRMHKVKNFAYSFYPYEDKDQIEAYLEFPVAKHCLNELTEVREMYDISIFDDVSEKPLTEKTSEEVLDTVDRKWTSFQHCVPIEYIESCVDLVTESFAREGISITEKTWKPVVIKKPFLVMGARNYHTWLKRMGYELYGELFDYSFDSKLFYGRFESIVKQITDICQDFSVEDFAKQVEKLHPKVEYNYNHYQTEIKKWLSIDTENDEQFIADLKRLNEGLL